MDSLKNKHQELTASYGEKVRSCVRAQKMYDELKKQMLQLNVQNAAADAVSHTLESSQRSHHSQSKIRSSQATNQFAFRPPGLREANRQRTSNSSGSGGKTDNLFSLPPQGYNGTYAQYLHYS